MKGKTAIVGIGNIMRADDGCGPRFIERLKARGTDSPLFDCGTAPENYIFPILSTASDTVMLIDAADFGGRPGEVRLFDVEEISKTSLSTHSLSPRLLIDLLKTGKENLNIAIVSIQPKTTVLGAPLSEEVKRGIDELAGIFAELLSRR